MFKNILYKSAISIVSALIWGYKDLENERYILFTARFIFIFVFAQAFMVFSQRKR